MISNSVTIVVPVYGDWPSLQKCIASLQRYVNTTLHRVILVNDCGPDVELMEHNITNVIKDEEGFAYYRNKKNLGFIGTCNRAVAELDTSDNNILLLNSDTEVTNGFLEEMIAVLNASTKNGAVSPRSNNATIATVPLSSAAQKGIGAKKSFAIYQKLKPHFPPSYEVPVAHGFCMLIRRSLIQKYGLFDNVFGKGYGEEVDFCLRIKKHGYKSLLANHAYVFHLEARSFSLETKAKLLEKNNQIIWERYPDYRQQVRDYMDKAIPCELELQKKAGIPDVSSKKAKLKSLIKRNKHIYSATKKVRRTLWR